jgi:KDO2-lipid IV(A) lauroyltransferase
MKTLLRFLLHIQYLAEFAAVWPLVALVRRLSEPTCRRLARALASVAYRLLSHDRRWAHRNLELVFGDSLTAAQRTRIAMKSFEHIVLTRAEALRWSRDWMVSNVIEEGGEHARQAAREAAEKGLGIIMITPHLGNYELIPPWCYHTGWRGPVMYRPQNNPYVEKLLAGARAEYLENRMIPRGPFATLSLMYALRDKQGVGLLIDQNTLDGGVFVEFLGFAAATPPGAAALALATGAPVVPAVAVRRADGRNRLIFHPPFPLIRTGDRKSDIVANTQQYTRAFESWILAYPEQYNWPHPRWRFRPDGGFWRAEQPRSGMERERLTPPRRRRSQTESRSP